MKDRWGSIAEVGDIVLYAPSTKGTIEYGKILQVDEARKTIKVYKFVSEENNKRRSPDSLFKERTWAIFYVHLNSNWVLVKSLEEVSKWQQSLT